MTLRALPQAEVTKLLLAWSEGDASALEQLMPVVYQELRRLAKRYMGQERPGHTLQATALVNEVYLRLIDVNLIRWQSRAHFFAVSAQIMRRILVEFARRRNRQKRGDGALLIPLDDALLLSDGKGADLLVLDEALTALAKQDSRMSQVV